ncbi:Zn(II)2Cys6 transcription factor [Phanerochaete sordida]|uniref:Zn(II)2Cys6 transcription factor n=1 Tax=Phanerochaete sordida TaxID=48140 RepID=A0A9P3G658_9APHY|nr:Zn(II)2Cys6 transcription factor [Phanerochaete sordida]
MNTNEPSNSAPGPQQEGEVPRIPRRTPMACSFCRGRKLKCDGRTTCGNCERRGIPCTYVPVAAQQK